MILEQTITVRTNGVESDAIDRVNGMLTNLYGALSDTKYLIDNETGELFTNDNIVEAVNLLVSLQTNKLVIEERR